MIYDRDFEFPHNRTHDVEHVDGPDRFVYRGTLSGLHFEGPRDIRGHASLQKLQIIPAELSTDIEMSDSPKEKLIWECKTEKVGGDYHIIHAGKALDPHEHPVDCMGQLVGKAATNGHAVSILLLKAVFGSMETTLEESTKFVEDVLVDSPPSSRNILRLVKDM